MIQESSQSGLESIAALRHAISGNNKLSEYESEENIINNLVLVGAFQGGDATHLKTKSCGTGFLLTTDGFILTAYHNIAPYDADWHRIIQDEPPTAKNIFSWMEKMKLRYAVIDQNRRAYPIDITCRASCPTLDIALIKAVMFRKPTATAFRVATKELERGDEIMLLGLRNQRLYNQFGKVISTCCDVRPNNPSAGGRLTYDTFLTDAYGVPGFSGGVFSTMKGEFAGLSLYIEKEIGKSIGHTGGAKAKHIVEFIGRSAIALERMVT